ncbi:MAG: DUF1491 family protein [Pseudomonadota bacterium]
MSRLTSGFWVDAYRMRLEALGIPVMVVAKGDATAGAVFIKLNTLDGQATLYHRSFNLMTGARVWDVLVSGTEAEVDGSISKQRSFDPDLWVIEVEDREGRHLLDDPSLA